MLSNELTALLAPFARIVNKNALSPTYRSIEVTPTHVRACASYAQLEVAASLIESHRASFCVDATSFLAIIRSLPNNKEVYLDNAEGVLSWSCGEAKGRLAILPDISMPRITRADAKTAWTPVADFKQALLLGSMSCGNDSMATVGMFGIVIDNRGDLCVQSSDNITIASSFVMDGAIPNCPGLITLSPDACALLASLLPGDTKKTCLLEFDTQSIYLRSGSLRCVIKQVAPLKHDIDKITTEWASVDIVVPIPTERISAFIKRVDALSDSKKGAVVSIGAAKGRLSLSFAESTASSDEYYLVEGLEVPDLPEVKLDASKTARALAHVSEVALDHIERGIIVFQGADPQFTYIISAKR